MISCYICRKSEPEVELRPYGPNQQFICFQCMKSDPEREAEAKRQFDAQATAAGPVVIIGETTGPRPFHKKGVS